MGWDGGHCPWGRPVSTVGKVPGTMGPLWSGDAEAVQALHFSWGSGMDPLDLDFWGWWWQGQGAGPDGRGSRAGSPSRASVSARSLRFPIR